MNHELGTLYQLLLAGQTVIRIVVVATKGSTPREVGATMLVHAQGIAGTLGGGNLEFQAIAQAQTMLAQTDSTHYQQFSLAAALGQCCGGIVDLWWTRFSAQDSAVIAAAYQQLQQQNTVVLASLVQASQCQHVLLTADNTLPELADAATALMSTAASGVSALSYRDMRVLLTRLDNQRTPLWLFGAGHVGQALVHHLRDLPFEVTWVDSRADIYPAQLSSHVHTLLAEDPADVVRHAPTKAWFLIMTHDHQLDFAICTAILARTETAFVGLIGSRTKAARFNHRLTRMGYQPARITCPIGIAGITGKEPAMIALSVAAQLMRLREVSQLSQTTPQTMECI